MPKSTFIPAADHDFLVWIDHFIANLTPNYGTADADLAALKAASADFRDKTLGWIYPGGVFMCDGSVYSNR